MSTDLTTRAAEAWSLVVRPRSIFDTITGRDPMPPAIAIDFVQECNGDRDDAVTALLHAAADWLQERIPAEDVRGVCDDAIGLCGEIRGECIERAYIAQATIAFRAEDVCHSRFFYAHTVSAGEFIAAVKWNNWCDKAKIALDFTREIIRAAYPVGVTLLP